MPQQEQVGAVETSQQSGMNYQDNRSEPTPTPTPPPVAFVPTAPTIAAGTPLDELDVYRAFIDEVNRFRLHKANPVAVTGRDVARATLRKANIIQQHLMAMYPQQAPQWAIDLEQRLQQQLGDQINRSEQRFQELLQQSERRLEQQLVQIEQGVGQEIQHGQVQLSKSAAAQQVTPEQQHQGRAAGLGDRCLNDAVADRHFQRFVKVTPGLGNGLPGAPAPVDPIPLLQVGEIVPVRFFPATPAELLNWSHRQINSLSILLNDDFGIERADKLNERRHMLLHYLITGY